MKPISVPLSRAEQTYQVLLDEICDGSLPAGTPLIQEELAAQLGVSRQPVQQALARLKGDGLLEDAPGRGLCVPAIDLSRMRSHYEIRSSLDRLAARLAADRIKDATLDQKKVRKTGHKIIDAGARAIAEEKVSDMISLDIEFHSFIYTLSGNPLIATTAESHWRYLRRVMGDILRRAEPPVSIWQQHEAILQAVVSGDANTADKLAACHIDNASEALFNELTTHDKPTADSQRASIQA
ncbi:MAG: GntR family transcriptional regulator [Granulosicoccus sp.]